MTQPTSDDIEKMIDAAARGSMEKRAKVIEDADLREQVEQIITAEYYSPNAEPAAKRIDRLMRLIKQRDAAIRIDELNRMGKSGAFTATTAASAKEQMNRHLERRHLEVSASDKPSEEAA